MSFFCSDKSKDIHPQNQHLFKGISPARFEHHPASEPADNKNIPGDASVA